ncbi:MAG: hypothetical protein J5965_11925 [Aeriscardovia sp.]|nr:hypothetical protein [Aeriscardovia sp.]
MKHSLILFLLLTSLHSLKAQDSDYRPFIEEGKVWVSKCDKSLDFEGLPAENPGDKPYSYLILYNYFEGDTIVDNKVCKRWIHRYVGPKSGKSKAYVVPVYEEEKKVWFYLDENVRPYLMYDFGASVGDSIVVAMPDIQLYLRTKMQGYGMDIFMKNLCDTLVIYSIGEETHGDRLHLTTHFFTGKQGEWWQSQYTEYNLRENFIMQGIGPQWYPLWNFCVIGNTQAPWLMYCVVGDEVLYENKQLAEHWSIPLPTSITSPSDKSVNSESENSTFVNSNFLDLSGRRFPTLPTQKGIYIKDGRKVLIK